MNLMLKSSRLLMLILLMVAAALPLLPVVAAEEPHQNPDETVAVFSGFALFDYYADTLIMLIGKEPDAVRERIEKMPFANIPESLLSPTADFVSATTLVSEIVFNLETEVEELELLSIQSRLEEATILAEGIAANIGIAYSQLDRMEKSAIAGGAYFTVAAAPAGSDIEIAYNRLIGLIQQIRSLLDLQSRLHENLTNSVLSLGSSGDIKNIELTMTASPMTAFVGDNVTVSGRLTSDGVGLTNKEIEILLNSETCISIITDSKGLFVVSIQIPFVYQNELKLQALYYPKGTDRENFFAALSGIVTIDVLYYETIINLSNSNKAYPGRELTVEGNITYKTLDGSVADPVERNIEIYFDNNLVEEISSINTFSYSLLLGPDIILGSHLITATVSANARYAPSYTNADVQIVKARPYFLGTFPAMLWIPGNFYLQGQFKSEIGLLDSPAVNIKLGNNSYEYTGDNNGSVFVNDNTKYDFSLFGSQKLEMVVTPSEAWHGRLLITKEVLMINYINCGLFFIVILVFAIILPRRFKINLRQISARRLAPSLDHQNMPVYSGVIGSHAQSLSLPEENNDAVKPVEKLVFVYRLILKIIQTITHLLLKPNQTLREYAREVESKLGKVGTHFLNFTRLIEKSIYSQGKMTQDEVTEGEKLADTIRQGTKQ